MGISPDRKQTNSRFRLLYIKEERGQYNYFLHDYKIII